MEYNLKDASFRRSAEKEEGKAFCVLRSVLHFPQSCYIKGLWLSDSSENQALYKSLFAVNAFVNNSDIGTKLHSN